MNFHQKILSGTNIIRGSNGLDTDLDRHMVGPDRSLICLQRLSAEVKVAAIIARKELSDNVFACTGVIALCLYLL